MDTESPIQFITYLALNKDRIFHLSQADFCQTMQVFSVERKNYNIIFWLGKMYIKMIVGFFFPLILFLMIVGGWDFFFFQGIFSHLLPKRW